MPSFLSRAEGFCMIGCPLTSRRFPAHLTLFSIFQHHWLYFGFTKPPRSSLLGAFYQQTIPFPCNPLLLPNFQANTRRSSESPDPTFIPKRPPTPPLRTLDQVTYFIFSLALVSSGNDLSCLFVFVLYGFLHRLEAK